MCENYFVYFPEFSITNGILKNIGRIEASKALIEHTPVQPNLVKKIEEEAEFKNTFHTIHFEGVPLRFEEAKKAFNEKSQDIKYSKEIENYRIALNKIRTITELSEDILKSLHKDLLKDIAPENKTGNYRSIATVIKGTSIYSPSPDEILATLRSFFSWFESNDAKELPAPLRSAILYFEIVKIQPFEAESKKIAGLVALANLYIENYDIYKVISLEPYFDENPTAFFNVIKSTQTSDGDLTRWLEYYLNGLADNYAIITDRIINLAKDSKLLKIAGMIPLNDRQERIVEYIHDYGSVQNKDFAKMFSNVSEDTILRDLKDLMNKEIITKVGSTKSARYIAVNKP